MAQSIRTIDMRLLVSVSPKSNQKLLTLSQVISITMKETQGCWYVLSQTRKETR